MPDPIARSGVVPEAFANAADPTGIELKVIGTEAVRRRLVELDAKTRRQTIRKALRRGGAFMDRMLTQAAPRRATPYGGRRAAVRKPGDLARSIMAKISIRQQAFESSVKIGPTGRFNPGIGAMLEFGTVDRMTKGKRGKKPAYRGAVSPRFWMSRTYRTYKDTALAIIEQTLEEELFK